MKLENKNILVVSNEEWGDVWFSKHNYAWELAKTNKVFFINSPRKWKFRNMFKNNFESKSIHENLSIISIQNKFPSKFNFLKEINNFIACGIVKNNIIKDNPEKFILWSFTPLFLFRPKLLGIRHSIFHIVDRNWTHFYGTQHLAKQAFMLIIVSKNILSEYSAYANKSILIPHGISEEEFVLDEGLLTLKKKELRPYGKFALFIGSIDQRLDYEFLNKLLHKCKDVNFVFIGPLCITYSHPYFHLFKSNNNLVHLGVRHYKELKYYISLSNFCITPMDIHYPGNNIAHHKTLPILAQGKMIFSPKFLDYDELEGLIIMDNNQDVLIDKIISFKEKEDPAIITNRILYAKKHSYSLLLSKIERFINEAHRSGHIQ